RWPRDWSSDVCSSDLDAVMHEGYWSTVLGLRGWPSAGEEMIVARNILLAETTGARVHCQHLSAAGSVQMLREAKKRGLPISGEEIGRASCRERVGPCV